MDSQDKLFVSKPLLQAALGPLELLLQPAVDAVLRRKMLAEKKRRPETYWEKLWVWQPELVSMLSGSSRIQKVRAHKTTL